MTDIKAAQFGLEPLPLNFRAIVVIHRESQKVCTEIVHIFLIDERGHDVENILMDGLYSFLLAFSLTLVKVINTLLVG